MSDATWHDGETLLQAAQRVAQEEKATLTGLDFLVGTATGTLSAEIAVGTTPGGELGNTWASPTVDATHSGTAHLDLTPWRGEISCVAPPSDSDSAPALDFTGGGYTQCYAITGYATGAYWAWDVTLAAGTYDFDFVACKDVAAGIATFTIDGSTIGSTWDGYAATFTLNQLPAWHDVTIATTGKHTLKVQCNSKNASATYYRFYFQQLSWQRTA